MKAKNRDDRLSGCIGISWIAGGKKMLVGGPGTNDHANKLWLIDLASGESKQLQSELKMHQLALHPDGKRIAFTCPESRASGEIWTLENFLQQ